MVVGVSSGRMEVDLNDENAINAAIREEHQLEDADFDVNYHVNQYEDMTADVDESGLPGCCYRDCCVGRPHRRNRCIRRANICHRRGGGWHGNGHGNGWHITIGR